MKNIEVNIVASPSLIDDCISVGQMLNALNKTETAVDISAKFYTDLKDLIKDEANRTDAPNHSDEKIILALTTEAEYIADEDEDDSDVDPEILFRFTMCLGIKDEECNGATYSYLKILKDTGCSPLLGAFTYDGNDSLCINVIMHLIALNHLDISNVSIHHESLSYKGVCVGNMSNTHYIRHNSSLVDAFDLDKGTRDAMFLAVFKNATAFSQLTYSAHDDEETEAMLKDFYSDSAVEDKKSFVNFCNEAWTKRAEIISVMVLNNRLDKLNEMINAGIAKGSSIETEEDIDTAVSIWEDAIDFAKTFDCPADWWWHLLNHYVVFLYNNGLNEKAYPFAKRLLHITESDLNPNEEEYYKTYYVVGCVAFGLEKIEEAFELFFKYLSYAQENFDETWDSIRDIYHTIAAYYIRVEDFDNAYTFSRNVVEICEKHPPTTKQGKENLSIYLSIYAHSLKGMGQTDDAIKYYRQALELQYESAACDTLQLGVLYDNLGNCYDDLGKYNESIGCHLKAAEILERLCGPMCEDLHVVYHNVASCYSNLDMPSLASEYFDKSDEVYSFHHPLD